MIHNINLKRISKIAMLSVFMMVMFFSVWTTIYAVEEYTVLAPLPGTTDVKDCKVNCKTTLGTYLPGLFNFSIGVAAVMAFAVITYGGIMYMTSDAITGKSQGREYIENALWGLLLIIGAWIILYTINPKILDFTFTIDKPNVGTYSSTVTPGGVASGSSVGCNDPATCRYSYVNNGVTILFKDCLNCVYATAATMDGLNIKVTNISVNGRAQETMMNGVLEQNLVYTQHEPGTPAFQVTETWPPTVNHAEQGQYDGTSVDVSLSTQSNSSPSDINKFITNAAKHGLRAQYEVGTEPERQYYLENGVSSSGIRTVPYITGPHFSIYMN